MRQFTADEIQEQFEKLPADVQAAVTSTEVNDKIEAIAKKYNLLIDQTGELVDEIGLAMLGLVRSGDFVEHLISRCSISRKAALEIAEDVNTDVFSTIKKYMRELEEKHNINVSEYNRESDISALEQIGGFEILKENESGDVIENNAGTGNWAQNRYVENIEADNLIASPKEVIVEKREVKVTPPTPVTPPAALPPKPTPPRLVPTPRPAPPITKPTPPIQKFVPPVPPIQEPVPKPPTAPIPPLVPIHENRNVPINRVQQNVPKPIPPKPIPPQAPVQAKPVVKPSPVVQIPTPVITIPKPIPEIKITPEIQKTAETPVTVPIQKKTYANDPYHEPF